MSTKSSRNKAGVLSNNKGFTLIEMAIVLIIIGIILGAVVKGKDLVKGAEQKRIFNQYVKEWQIAFNNYYDRTGWILADTDTADNSGARNGACDSTVAANLDLQLQNVGLNPPPDGTTGLSYQRTYVDSNGIQRTLTLAFYNHAALGNYIGVAGVPNDLGMSWDRIVDSQRDGTAGDILYLTTITDGATTAAWPAATVAPVAGSGLGWRLEF